MYIRGHFAEDLEFSWHRLMSRLFEAWKPVSGAKVTERIKMAETTASGIDISISSISL